MDVAGGAGRGGAAGKAPVADASPGRDRSRSPSRATGGGPGGGLERAASLGATTASAATTFAGGAAAGVAHPSPVSKTHPTPALDPVPVPHPPAAATAAAALPCGRGFRFSAEERGVLEQEFRQREGRTPPRPDCIAIATQFTTRRTEQHQELLQALAADPEEGDPAALLDVTVTAKQIKQWFENKRRRVRKKTGAKLLAPPAMPELAGFPPPPAALATPLPDLSHGLPSLGGLEGEALPLRAFHQLILAAAGLRVERVQALMQLREALQQSSLVSMDAPNIEQVAAYVRGQSLEALTAYSDVLRKLRAAEREVCTAACQPPSTEALSSLVAGRHVPDKEREEGWLGGPWLPSVLFRRVDNLLQISGGSLEDSDLRQLLNKLSAEAAEKEEEVQTLIYRGVQGAPGEAASTHLLGHRLAMTLPQAMEQAHALQDWALETLCRSVDSLQLGVALIEYHLEKLGEQ